MASEQLPSRFNYVTFPAADIAAQPERASYFASIAHAAFGLQYGAIDEIFGAESKAHVLMYTRARQQMPNKIAVFAIGYFNPRSALVPYIADRSRRRTSHVEGFLSCLEKDVFSERRARILTIEPNKISVEVFQSREYVRSAIEPLAFQLTMEAYRER